MKTRLCRTKFCRLSTGLLPILLGVLAVGGLLMGAQPASANNCLHDLYNPSGPLNCTANDVSIAEVTHINITSGGSCTGTPQTCTCNGVNPPPTNCSANPGQLGCVTFEADFKVLLTAQTRFDIGFYIATDGDTVPPGLAAGDGAKTGLCQAFVITQAAEVDVNGSPNPTNFTNIDGDSCGNIDATHNPQFLRLAVSTACVGDASGHLKLPTCTTWQQPGADTVCTGAPAFPGAPSKCNCNPGFTVNILVEHPEISVEKTASPTSVPEPSGTVTYTVHVTNNGTSASVTLTALTEDDTNDGTVDFTFNSSSTPTLASICGTTTLAPLASTDCTFTRTVSGNAGEHVTDKVCVSGTDSNGGTVTPKCDTATVSIAGVGPTAAVTKTLVGLQCALVRYHVKVENTDPVESLSLTALSDDTFGDITSVHDHVLGTTCGVASGVGTLTGSAGAGTLPANIAVSGKYQCDFDAEFCGSSHTDTVTATLTDGDKHCSTTTTTACLANADCPTGETCVLNEITPSGGLQVCTQASGILPTSTCP